MRHGGLKAQVSGTGQRYALVVDERVDNRLAVAVARLEGDGRGGLLRAKDGLEFDDVIVTSERLGHVKIRARHVQHAFQLPTLEVPVSRFLHIGRPECNHSPRTISVGLRVGRNQVYAVLVEIRDGQLAVVQPLCGERNVCVHRGIGIEQFASGIVVPARKRVAIIGRAGRQLSGCHGPDVKPHGALGTTRCVQPRFIKVVAQSNLLERPLGIYRNIFGRHGHVGKVIGYGALRVGVPALKFIDGRQRVRTVGHDKPGLRDIGLILVRNAATLRAIDIDDVVAIAPIVEFSIGVLVAFRRAIILDGREALNHVAVLGADDKIGGVLGHVFVMLDKVHVPVQERTSLAFVQRLNIVRGSVGTTAIACSSECSTIHRHSALESDIFLVGNLVVSVAVVHGPLRRSDVSAPLLRDSGIYLSARPLFVLECQRIHRTRVIHVDDGRTVTFDGLLGNRLCGERNRATGNSLAIDVSTRDRTVVLAHCSRLLARDTIQRLRLMVGVTVVIGILPPVDDRIANRDSLPVGSQRRIVLRDERRCVDFITGCIEPPLEGIAGASGKGVLKVERRTRVDKLVTHRRTTGGIEGHPDATLDDGVQADRSRLIRHANILGNVDGSIRLSRPSHQVELRAHVVNHAAEVMLCVVADTLGPHDLGSVGIVEIDIETIFIVSVQHDGFGFTDTRLDAERAKHSTTFVVPTCEGLALDNGCLGCHEYVAILHDLLADNGGAVGGQEAVGCQIDGVLVRDDVDREVVDVEALDVGAGLACGDCLNAGGVVGHAVHTHGLALAHAGVEEAHAHGAVGLNGVAVLVNERDVESHGAFKRATLLLDGTGHGGSDVGAVHGLGQHARTLGQSALGGRHLHGDIASVGIAEESGICGLLGLGRDCGLFGRRRLCCRLLSGSGLNRGLLGRSGRGRLLGCGLLGRCGGLLGRRLLGGSRRLLGGSGGLLSRGGFNRGLPCRSGFCRRLGNRGSLCCGLLGRCGLYRGLSNDLRRTCSLYLGYRFGCRRADDILLFALRGTHCGAVRSRLAPVALRQGRGHHRHLGPHHDQRHEDGEYLAYVLGRVE